MYITSFSGAHITPVEGGLPRLYDIAVNHCRTPMFAGHSGKFYSVAHHCVAAAKLAEMESMELAFFTILHETECVLYGDIPGPMKTPEQKEREKAFRSRIWNAFGHRPGDDTWGRVELYDKLEQRASIYVIGHHTEIHQSVWDQCASRQEAAKEVVRNIYEHYPPKDQLEPDSPLLFHFIDKVFYYAGVLGLIPVELI